MPDLEVAEENRQNWRGGRRAVQILTVASCIVGLLACDPIGSPNSSTSSSTHTPARAAHQAPGASAKADTQQPEQAKAACTAPFPDEPAPKAEPAAECPEGPVQPLALPRGFVSFPDASGKPRVAVEVASNDSSRQRGLMYRTSMAPEEGMLFTWPTNAPRSFWMKNTCLPLDMLFLDSQGFVVGILEQVPVLNEHPRSVPCPAAFVLEMNAGWSRDHGVKPGQRVKIEYSSE